MGRAPISYQDLIQSRSMPQRQLRDYSTMFSCQFSFKVCLGVECGVSCLVMLFINPAWAMAGTPDSLSESTTFWKLCTGVCSLPPTPVHSKLFNVISDNVADYLFSNTKCTGCSGN